MNHEEILSLAEKALHCKKCNGQIHIVTDFDPHPNIRSFITAHCPNGHFHEVGWYTDPDDGSKVLTDLINKWNEANAK